VKVFDAHEFARGREAGFSARSLRIEHNGVVFTISEGSPTAAKLAISTQEPFLLIEPRQSNQINVVVKRPAVKES
jgi:hypothetical protein